MKFVWVLVVFIISDVTCLKDERSSMMKKWYKQCFDETKVKPAMLWKLKAGNWDINNNLLKKWTLCVLNKYGIMSKQGVFQLDSALAMVPNADKEVVEGFIDECLPKKMTEPDQIAWLFAKCYHTRAKDQRHKHKKLHYLRILK